MKSTLTSIIDIIGLGKHECTDFGLLTDAKKKRKLSFFKLCRTQFSCETVVSLAVHAASLKGKVSAALQHKPQVDFVNLTSANFQRKSNMRCTRIYWGVMCTHIFTPMIHTRALIGSMFQIVV